MDDKPSSFPNSVWERTWEGNSVPQAGVSGSPAHHPPLVPSASSAGGAAPPPADTPSSRNRVSPASAFPNGVWERGAQGVYLSSMHGLLSS